MSEELIDEFRGDYWFLSNFSESEHIVLGIKYPTVEHSFQAMKSTDPLEMYKVAQLPTPKEAKKYGRQVDLRPDWENIKITVMKICVMSKFIQNHDLAVRLVKTGSADLVEGNDWNDTFWGICNGEGQNHLGEILMYTRNQLRTMIA